MSSPFAEASEHHSPKRPRRMRFSPFNEVVADQSTSEVTSVNGPRQREGASTAPLAQRELHTPPALASTPGPVSSFVAPIAMSYPQSTDLARTWKPGTLGFDSVIDPDDAAFEQQTTIRTMAVDLLINQQGQPKINMQSEVTGTAGAAGLVGLGNIVGSVLKYGCNFLIQYGFGPAVYGLYTLSLSLINLITSIFNLGLDDAMVRYVAIYRGKNKSSPLQGLVIFCTLLAGLAGLVAAILLLFFTPYLVHIWSLLRPGQSANNKDTLLKLMPLLQLMAPLIPLLCMQVIWFAGLRGFKAFKFRVLATSVVQPALQLALLFAVLVFFRYTIGIALALLASTLVSTILALNFLLRQVVKVATPEREEYRLREWLTFATINFLTAIIDTVLDSIDTLLLASFSVAKTQLGLYGASIRLSAFISLPLLSLNNVFAPTIAELHSKGEKARLETMFKAITKWAITFSFPIFLITVLFSPYLLSLSGKDFIPAWPLVIAFALGNLLNSGTGSVGYMLLMTGYNKLSFINSLVAIAVNVVLGIILTPRYGAMGTAISTGLAICALNSMRLLQVRLLLKMQPYRLDTLKPIIAGLISSIFTGAGLYFLSQMKWHVVLGHAIISAQLALIPVFLASYIGLLILFKGSPEDEIVMKALRKKFSRGAKNKTRKK